MAMNFSRSLIAGSLLSVALVPVEAPAAPTVFSCSPTKVIGVASVAAGSVVSTSFVNIPEAGVNFTQGGAAASCVIVRFSAETLAGIGGADILFVRAFLDNTTAAQPPFARYSAVENVYRAHTFEFVFPSVTPGAHTIRMQYRSSSGSLVSVGLHTLVVHYK